MTERAAAQAVGISRETLRNAESGAYTPRGETIAALAQQYGVSIDWLFVSHDGNGDTPRERRG